MKWLGVVLGLAVLSGPARAQEDPHRFSVVVKGGASYYRGLYYGSLGGGSVNSWGTGPILGAGVEYSANKVIRLQSTLEYASHPFTVRMTDFSVENSPRNTIVDLSAHVRVVMGVLYVFAGPALSYQHIDDVVSTGFPGYGLSPGPWTTPGAESLRLAFNLGAGLQAQTSEKVTLFAEGSIRGRQYISPVLQGGIMVGL